MKKLLLICCVGIALASCGRVPETDNQGKEVVVYQEESTMTFANLPFLQEIEIVPIESSESALIGESPTMIEDGGEYFIVDHNRGRILRIDSDGKYVNTIGSLGRGPNEYLKLTCAEISGDSVRIYCSRTQAEYLFSKAGEFIAKTPLPFLFRSITKEGDNYWVYLGYRNKYGDDRLVKINSSGETVGKFLPSDATVLVVDERDPMFIHSGDNLLFRESLSNNILRLHRDSVSVAWEFDFGKYSLPGDYFKMSDPFSAAELLEKNDFANIKKWVENDAYAIAEVVIQKTGDASPVCSYAFKEKSNGKWYWIHSPVRPDPNYLVGSLGDITPGSELLLLVEPYKLIKTSPEERAAFKNPEVIASLKDDDNYVILKCKLRR